MKQRTASSKSTFVEYDDGRSKDDNAIKQINQSWIDNHMKDREEEFTKSKEMTVYCATWNVNAKKQEETLDDWLLTSYQQYADVYAIGFQEIVDLNAMNVALDGSKTAKNADFWERKILETLGSNGNRFTVVLNKSLVGLCLIVLVKDAVYQHVKDVRAANLGVGLMGVLGNKGAVAIRMSLHDSSVCFVTAHLAAHRDNVAGRNSDYKNIIQRIVFTSDLNKDGYYDSSSNVDYDDVNSSGGGGNNTTSNYYENTALKVGKPQRGAALTQGKDLYILDHEFVFFFGDFNYRMDEAISKEEVFRLSDLPIMTDKSSNTNNVYNMNINNNITSPFSLPPAGTSALTSVSSLKDGLAILKEYDQLNLERKKGSVFQGFEEADLTFRPTYKFQPGTDLYEQRPEKKLRAPAWCDRILWYQKKPKSVKNTLYKSSKLTPSDHKPVAAKFHIEVKDIITDKELKVFNVLKTKLEQSFRYDIMPQVEINNTSLLFTHVRYDIKSTSTITIKNTGNTLAHWHFIHKLEEYRVCKKWLSIDITSGLLLPQESIVIKISVHIDKKTAQAINQGKDSLDDVLVLRIENFNDFYINCKVEYLRSCYGMSLEELVYTLKPVRSTELPATTMNTIITGNTATSSPTAATSNSNTTALNTAAIAALNSTSQPLSLTQQQQGAPLLSIPKELWRLVDALWSGNALREKDLFATEADVTELAAVRESLDTSTDFPSCAPHALAEAIVILLAALPSPLLPPKYYPTADIETSSNMKIWSRTFLENLPPLNYTVFVYMIAFFREVLAQQDYNRSTISRIVNVCLDCMTYSAVDHDLSKEERDRRATKLLFLNPVITYFLTATNI